MSEASTAGMADVVSPLDKGLGALSAPCAPQDAAAQGWNLLREDLGLPAAVLSQSRLAHNLAWMQRFVDAYGAKLAPHGKTTMAPRLFRQQIDAGAWGITLATAQQTRVAHAHGVRRVLMANQLIGRRNMAAVAELLADPGFEFFCLVDCAEQVEQLAAFFGAAGQSVQVLIELGPPGGRTGVRSDAQMQPLLDALARAGAAVRLAGIEVYEGVLKEEDAIRTLLRRAVHWLERLAGDGRLQRSPAVLTGAGSAWYDVVAQEFGKADIGERWIWCCAPAAISRMTRASTRQRSSASTRPTPWRSRCVPACCLRCRSGPMCSHCPSLAAPSWRWASAIPPSRPCRPGPRCATAPVMPRRWLHRPIGRSRP